MRPAALLLVVAAFGGILVAPTASATTDPSTQSAGTAGPISYQTVQTVYGSGPVTQKLTAYVPTNTELKPAILFVHGGCWRRGTVLGSEARFAQELVRRTGYVVAVMTYRVSKPRYKTEPADVAAALRVLQTSPSLSVDPTRVALWGESAGAQLALLKAYSTKGRPQVGRPAAVVAISGVSDMRTAYGSTKHRCMNEFEGGPPSSPAMIHRYDKTSGITWVDRSDPATFLAHAYGDSRASYNQSAQLAQTLSVNHVAHQLVSVPGMHHGLPLEFDTPPRQKLPVYRLAIGFLRGLFEPAA
jgi:acetyl esterase/lipase